MTVQDSKHIMARMIEEVWNEGHLDAAEELFAPDHTSPSAPDLPPGAEGVKMMARMFREAMPDYHMSIDIMVAEETRVAARFIQTGTHTGQPFLGMEASGHRAEWSEIGELLIRDGEIASSWYVPDMLGLVQQLSGQAARLPAPRAVTASTPVSPLDGEKAQALVERFVDVLWREGRVDVIDQIVAEDYVDWEIDPSPAGRADLAGFITAFRGAFGDLDYELQEVFCEGDLVFSRDTVRATHTGDFAGLPRTGKRVVVSAMHIMRVQNGRIAEHWGETDRMSMMQQLGVPGG